MPQNAMQDQSYTDATSVVYSSYISRILIYAPFFSNKFKQEETT